MQDEKAVSNVILKQGLSISSGSQDTSNDNLGFTRLVAVVYWGLKFLKWTSQAEGNGQYAEEKESRESMAAHGQGRAEVVLLQSQWVTTLSVEQPRLHNVCFKVGTLVSALWLLDHSFFPLVPCILILASSSWLLAPCTLIISPCSLLLAPGSWLLPSCPSRLSPGSWPSGPLALPQGRQDWGLPCQTLVSIDQQSNIRLHVIKP